MGAIDSLPLQGGSTQPVAIEGHPVVPLSEQPEVPVRRISVDYVKTVRMRLLSGRNFNDADQPDRPLVAIISASMARRFWPNEDPIGKHLTLGLISDAPRQVVGIVNDAKLETLNTNNGSAVYLPLTQVSDNWLSVLVRTTSPPATLTPSIVSAVRAIDPEQPVLDVMTLGTVVGRSFEDKRFAMLLLTAFAALALVLAAVGIYSVLSYSVTQRVPEIGIEMALGAPIASVLRKVIVEGLKPALIGLADGVSGALALAGAFSTMLYGVSVRDASTIGAVSVLVIVVTVFATLMPARRAALVDPMVALRTE